MTNKIDREDEELNLYQTNNKKGRELVVPGSLFLLFFEPEIKAFAMRRETRDEE